MSILEKITEAGHKVVDGQVSLFYMNGWKQKTFDLLEELEKHEVKGTSFHRGPADSQEMGFTYDDGEVKLEVHYKLDSGD